MANSVVKITCLTPETYRAVIKHLKETDVYYHTYQLQEERAYRVVLKYLHHTTEVEDIKQDLLQQGHVARNIVNADHRVSKEPLNLFFVDLEPAKNNKEVYKITAIQNKIIHIEPPRTNKHHIPQCARCQQYENTRSYCNRPYAFIKCGGHLVIPGYNPCCTNHPDGTAHWDTAILIKSTIAYFELLPYDEAEIQATSMKVRGPLNDIAIAAVYCPPKHNLKAKQFEKCFHTLGKNFIAGGDYNSKNTVWSSRLTTKGREIEKVLGANNYTSLSTGSPTYWPSDVNKILIYWTCLSCQDFPPLIRTSDRALISPPITSPSLQRLAPQ
jgi:hypothetical protein